MKAALRSLVAINAASLTFSSTLLVIILFIMGMPFLDVIELKTYDLRLRSRGNQPPVPDVVLAAIDEKSLDAGGQWPWPRARIADLVDILSRDGARVIGFDIGFLEADQSGALTLLNHLQQQLNALAIDTKALADFMTVTRGYVDNDKRLADAIKNASAAIILGYFFHMSDQTLGHELDQRAIDKQLMQIHAAKYPLVMYREAILNTTPFVKAYAPESNLALFSEAAASAGYFTSVNDLDGTIRWMPMIIQAGEDLYPPLAVMCVWHYLNKPQLTVQVGPYGVEGIEMGQRFIPTDERGRTLINYLGPPKTFPHVSVSDILSRNIPAGTFQDKIVIVSATATGTYDVRSTPVSSVYPGGEVHATIIDNILTQRFLTRPAWSGLYNLMAVVAMGLSMGIAIPRMRALSGFLLAASLFALHICIGFLLLMRYGVWLNLVYPSLALAATYTVLTVYEYVTEERQRQSTREAFKQYIPPLVMEAVLKDPEGLKLGGEEKVLTVLFSDLQGFSAYSEHYGPREITELLSEYYTCMTEKLFVHEGTLLSYVGDEIVAVFGAPIDQADHAERACAAALDMRDRRAVLNAQWTELGHPPLRARTGLNTGLMLVGNLGSAYRFSYNVLGDQVNLGSRLEGMNKIYGTEIIVSESTARIVAASYTLREIDLVRVVGREKPERIFELIALSSTALPREQEQALQDYAAGLEAYRQQCWDAAIDLFNAALDRWPTDNPSRTMVERCQDYKNTRLAEGWEGVFDAVQK